MLENLKKLINGDAINGSILENAVTYLTESDEDIKDIFLDDKDVVVVGAENDPVITKLVNELPELDDTEDVSDEDIKEMLESYIPEHNLDYSTDLLHESVNSPLGLVTESAVGDTGKLYTSKLFKDFNTLFTEATELENQHKYKEAGKKYSTMLPIINKIIIEANKISDNTISDKLSRIIVVGVFNSAEKMANRLGKAYGIDPDKLDKNAFQREDVLASLNAAKTGLKKKITEMNSKKG